MTLFCNCFVYIFLCISYGTREFLAFFGLLKKMGDILSKFIVLKSVFSFKQMHPNIKKVAFNESIVVLTGLYTYCSVYLKLINSIVFELNK